MSALRPDLHQVLLLTSVLTAAMQGKERSLHFTEEAAGLREAKSFPYNGPELEIGTDLASSKAQLVPLQSA